MLNRPGRLQCGCLSRGWIIILWPINWIHDMNYLVQWSERFIDVVDKKPFWTKGLLSKSFWTRSHVAFGPRSRLDDTPRGFLSKTAFGLKATLLLVQSCLGQKAFCPRARLDHKPCKFKHTIYSLYNFK
jgi:hypothetical protein